ncbi:MAG: STAS domain-containing protein [Oscillospiraceae bacterium]|nr:STAS domain-containing protein [Oscillospiraceae bacterium]
MDNNKQTRIELDDSLLLIAPVGRLDTTASAELKNQIAAYDAAGRDILVDFADVDYISSAGLRLLVALQKQAKSCGHTMTVKNINAVVREVFRISGFDKAFTVL